MKAIPFPDQIEERLKSSFQDRKAYAQVSTLTREGHPRSRTAHVHCLTARGEFAINTHMHSTKWHDLSRHQSFSICHFDGEAQTQFCIDGLLMYPMAKAKSQEDDKLLQDLWMKMRDEVRLTYHLYDANLNFELKDTPSFNLEIRAQCHGVIIFIPHRLEIYELSDKGFRFGKRREFRKTTEGWISSNLNILNSQTLTLV